MLVVTGALVIPGEFVAMSDAILWIWVEADGTAAAGGCVAVSGKGRLVHGSQEDAFFLL